MSCEHLVCAACAGPVEQGRCATCRATRERLHHEHRFAGVSPELMVVLLAFALLVVLVLQLG